jgi:hypothetical protein
MSKPAKMKKDKFTKKQFELFYPSDEACLEKIFKLVYSKQEKCGKCGKPFRYHKLKGLRLYSCQFCGHNVAPTANTIFHKSSTPLVDWFYALYLFSVSKNGVSAMELQRQLGVTYKTAWRIANRIRILFEADKKYCRRQPNYNFYSDVYVDNSMTNSEEENIIKEQVLINIPGNERYALILKFIDN